jgi:hypothetical protein
MKIGSDFEKIQWNINGWEFLEPNAFFGDLIIFIIATVIAFKIIKINSQSTFSKNWVLFYFVFGVGFLVGGFGHLLYNYTGVPGKLTSYFAGIIAVFFIEKAMISIHPEAKIKNRLTIISRYKFVIALVLEVIICAMADLAKDPSKALALPTINSVIGMGFSLGYLGYIYEKRIHPAFRYFLISTFILVPSAIFQAFKINLHPWMDRNDFSHVLLIISIVLYYMAIKRYLKSSNAPKFRHVE